MEQYKRTEEIWKKDDQIKTVSKNVPNTPLFKMDVLARLKNKKIVQKGKQLTLKIN